jgi:prepilin-type N-terminal cleavage/methylation domain-containing protein
MNHSARGFTLIELSIVLVIIGFIAGGVLVGRDLVRAAEVRATILQIEKYNTAVNTFRQKYGYLSGDIRDPDASSFGFAARGQYAGEGDGNGIIEGVTSNSANQNFGVHEAAGETLMFWADLSSAKLIDGTFTAASTHTPVTSTPSSATPLYLPPAKLGRGNYFYVWSGGYQPLTTGDGDGINYFGLGAVTGIANPTYFTSRFGLSVSEASEIDRKIDDGLPIKGKVTAKYLNWTTQSFHWVGTQGTAATAASASTCYDNNNVGGAEQQYSVMQSGGGNINCNLSIRFQ